MIEIEKYNSGHYEGISGYKYFVPSNHNRNRIFVFESYLKIFGED